ncbi:CHK domain-containing protein [Aphelenchoides fujianensis]|nr:CHK domain-containing protein [Aphelenchoides fujianensis]
MSVLTELVETIRRSAGRENLHDLHVESESHPTALLLPELRKLHISNPNGTNFVVYFVVEKEDDTSDALSASLGGFFNARYVHEYLKHARMKAKTGHYRFFVRKLCHEEPDRSFVALSLQWNHRGHAIKQLTVDQVLQTAESLAALHARGFDNPRPSYRQVVNDNHHLVQLFLTHELRHKAEGLIESLFSNHHHLFTNATRTRAIVHELLSSFTSFHISLEETPRTVLCHGNLCPANLQFDSDGNLHNIDGWEHGHFGHVAEDLSYLMITGLSAKDRRSNYLRVLRSYYYQLVEHHCVPHNKLHEMKSFYHEFLKRAVFFKLLTLEAEIEYEGDAEAKAAVHRWENVVLDAHEFESGRYVSDDQNPLTSQCD